MRTVYFSREIKRREKAVRKEAPSQVAQGDSPGKEWWTCIVEDRVQKSIAKGIAGTGRRSLQHKLVQVALHNHILHALHRLVKQIGVGRVCVVHVYFLVRVAHQALEFTCEKFLALLDIGIAAFVIREVLTNGCFAGGDLLAEEVNLVQEKNESRPFEVFAVGYALKEHQSLVHLVLSVSVMIPEEPGAQMTLTPLRSSTRTWS